MEGNQGGYDALENAQPLQLVMASGNRLPIVKQVRARIKLGELD